MNLEQFQELMARLKAMQEELNKITAAVTSEPEDDGECFHHFELETGKCSKCGAPLFLGG